MKRALLALSVSAVAFGVFSPCQAQQGEIPDFTFEPRQRPTQRLFTPPTSDLPATIQPRPRLKRKDRWWERPEPNQDALVTADEGEWMILIQSYSGPEKDSWARQLAAVLRDPKGPYRLRAFIYNYGREEAIAQEKRIEAFIQEQKAKYRKFKDALKYKLKGIKSKDTWTAPKIRIKRIPIKREAGVLVGGYKDRKTARKALDDIRRLGKKHPLDEKVVHLDRMIKSYKDKKTGRVSVQWVGVNPFQKAFVVRNPSLPRRKKKRWTNMKALRHWNSAEPFSLLKCRKKITLAIKEFYTPTQVLTANDSKGIMKGLGLIKGQFSEDPAAQSARNLAEMFKKMGFRAYVLHTKRSSLVSIGGFDSVREPRYRATKQRLDQILAQPDYARMKLFPQAYPMQVPH